jgi:hypothetical protein
MTLLSHLTVEPAKKSSAKPQRNIDEFV